MTVHASVDTFLANYKNKLPKGTFILRLPGDVIQFSRKDKTVKVWFGVGGYYSSTAIRKIKGKLYSLTGKQFKP